MASIFALSIEAVSQFQPCSRRIVRKYVCANFDAAAFGKRFAKLLSAALNRGVKSGRLAINNGRYSLKRDDSQKTKPAVKKRLTVEYWICVLVGTPQKLSEAISAEIEQHFQQGNAHSVRVGGVGEVDLRAWKATRDSGQVLFIRRVVRGLKPLSVPKPLESDFSVVQLYKHSQEYWQVAALVFKNAAYRIRISEIRRVTNKGLFLRYRRFVREHGITDERWTFHGTESESSLSIAANGFDLKRVGSRKGSAFGFGIYSSPNAEMAHTYARNDIVVCRTAVGNIEQALCSKRSCTPGFHSSANKPKNPGIIVCFNPAQMLPAYLVTVIK